MKVGCPLLWSRAVLVLGTLLGCSGVPPAVSSDGGAEAEVGSGSDGGPGDGDAGPDAGASPPLPPTVLGPFGLTSCDGFAYAVAVEVGGQTFRLNMDTGSASLAVASAACPSCRVDPDPLYRPGPTAADLGRRTTLIYEDGSSWTGEIYRDRARLVGMDAPVVLDVVAIDEQSDFIAAPTECGDGTTYLDDGILGLGPVGSGAVGTDDFIVQLARMYPGMGKAFAFQLCGLSGNLWMGGFDPAATAGPMQLVPLLPVDPQAAAYDVAVGGLEVAGQSLGFGRDDLGRSTVDSGTSDLLVPQAVFDEVVARVQADAAFQELLTDEGDFFDGQYCLQPGVSLEELDRRLPPVTLVLPSHRPGESVRLELTALTAYLGVQSDPSGPYVCAGIAPDVSTVLGARVLASQVTLIDREAHLVGFAPQKGCPSW